MKPTITALFLTIVLFAVNSQTIVKMSVPKQSEEPVKVVVLFDEEVPEGMPVVLGIMGYNVTGGLEPYTYEWIQNGNVVGTGDIVVITPSKGDQFTLKAIDKNRCFSSTPFKMKTISKAKWESRQVDAIKVYPTIVKNNIINIIFPQTENPQNAQIRLLDIKGSVLIETFTSDNYIIDKYLPDGTYFISVKTDDFNKVEKIIVKH
jgi:hypothetical protein